MFEKARIKLTILYLVIIMSVSLLFSAVIYRQITHEFRLRLTNIEGRFPLAQMGFNSPPNRAFILHEDYEFVRHRVILILAYANSVILFVSGIAGYYLAGKTLRPIELAMDEQKRFVADASHELKTPLTALQTTIEVALRDKQFKLKDAREILGEALAESKKLSRLTNDLLVLARLEQLPTTSKTDVNLKKVIDEKIKSLSPIIKVKKIVITKKTKNIHIWAHEESIERLVIILLDNAIKYTKKGGKIVVKLAVSRYYALFSVTDNGVGISKTDQKQIFDRFYKANEARSRSGESHGYGLGLSMAKKIVELHNGSIEVNSKLNVGSTFKVKLPIR